ncbi:MAG: hypothetical protein ACI4QU_03400 [Christensenellales bacterium]
MIYKRSPFNLYDLKAENVVLVRQYKGNIALSFIENEYLLKFGI